MLIRVGQDRAIFAYRMWRDPPGVRVLDRHGRETHFDLASRSANFKRAPDGALLLKHDQGVAVVDPERQFAMRELREVALAEGAGKWSASFSDILVAPAEGFFARFEASREELNLDPETGITDAVLLPDGEHVALLIHRSPDLVVFNPVTHTIRRVPIGARYAVSHGLVRSGALWFRSYDTLCRFDPETFTIKASEVLQPQFYSPDTKSMSSGFVGVPRFSEALSGWMVPRPYSGDILVISETTLAPVSRIPCGGRPYDAIEFDDGALLVLDHPFDVVRSAHVRDVRPLQA